MIHIDHIATTCAAIDILEPAYARDCIGGRHFSNISVNRQRLFSFLTYATSHAPGANEIHEKGSDLLQMEWISNVASA